MIKSYIIFLACQAVVNLGKGLGRIVDFYLCDTIQTNKNAQLALSTFDGDLLY